MPSSLEESHIVSQVVAMLEPQVVNVLGGGPQAMSEGRHLGVPGEESGTWGTPSFAIMAEGPWADSLPLKNVHFFINKGR